MNREKEKHKWSWKGGIFGVCLALTILGFIENFPSLFLASCAICAVVMVFDAVKSRKARKKEGKPIVV